MYGLICGKLHMRYPCGVGHTGPFVSAGTKDPEMNIYIYLFIYIYIYLVFPVGTLTPSANHIT